MLATDKDKPLSGKALNQKLYDEAFDVNELKLETKHNACFPAGTRITTDKGLKRIEDIQVGDMVLSKHESGIGEQEFKPVVKTIVHHNKPIFELTYAIVKNSTKAYGLSDTSILNLSRKGKVFGVKATPNHPFWVKGQGWTNLEDLKKGQLLEMKEEGYQAYVILSCPEYQTNHADVKASLGFTSVTHLDQFSNKNKKSQYTFQVYSENGDCTELLDGRSSYSPVHIEGKGEIYVTDNPRRDTVYNFEVADNHTYYIFDKLWVHNDKCPTPTNADVKRRQDNGTPPIQNVRIFHSKESANEYFRQNPTTTEIAIVKVGTARISKTTNKIMPSAKFELGVNNVLVARITDAKGVVKEINYEYIIFREHPDYYLKNDDGSFKLDANNNKRGCTR